MTEKGQRIKYVGIVLGILILLVPAVGIPMGLYFSTAPPSIDITYNYETAQEKEIINKFEKIGNSSSYFLNVEYDGDERGFIYNISEMLLEANTKVRRTFREYELSYEASISASYESNITQLNTTEQYTPFIYLSYFNSTTGNYSCIFNQNLIYEKLLIINNTGLLDDGFYFITQTLDEVERYDFLSRTHTFIERKIICNNVGQLLLIISLEYCLTMS